jgi:predicted nuclease of predicted toxin-antitoxin system
VRLLIDENVPDSVSNFLRERGHEVLLVRDIQPRGTPDPVIAALADKTSAIIVTFDSDFRALAKRWGVGRGRFRRCGRISFKCDYAKALGRIKQLIERIEVEYDFVSQQSDGRLMLQITATTFTVII